MGLSSYPTPVDARVLCLILINTAKFVSTVKKLVCFILNAQGIVVSWDKYNSITLSFLQMCLQAVIAAWRVGNLH